MDDYARMEELAYELITWVPAEDREAMLEGLAGSLGAEAAETVRHWYAIRAVNGDDQ